MLQFEFAFFHIGDLDRVGHVRGHEERRWHDPRCPSTPSLSGGEVALHPPHEALVLYLVSLVHDQEPGLVPLLQEVVVPLEQEHMVLPQGNDRPRSSPPSAS